MKWVNFLQSSAMSSLGLAAMILLSSASTSAALDGKVYPGAECVGSAYNGPLIHASNGVAINVSEAASLAACPIVTDNETNQAGLNVARIRVLESSDTGDDTFCSLYAVSANGSFIDANFGAVSGSGQRTINLAFATSPVHARYQLLCLVSGLSTLAQYEIEER